MRLSEFLGAQHVHYLGSPFHQSQDRMTVVDVLGHHELLLIAVGMNLRRGTHPSRRGTAITQNPRRIHVLDGPPMV